MALIFPNSPKREEIYGEKFEISADFQPSADGNFSAAVRLRTERRDTVVGAV